MSGSPSRVYIARLAGLPVYDPNGDQVGKVRDVVELKSIANDGVNAADFAIPTGYTDALQHGAAAAH